MLNECFSLFFYLLSKCPESVMAVCCLFYWLAQQVCSQGMPAGVRGRDTGGGMLEGKVFVIPWGRGQTRKGDYSRFSANRAGDETGVGNLNSRRSVGFPRACLLFWEEQPLGQQAV